MLLIMIAPLIAIDIECMFVRNAQCAGPGVALFRVVGALELAGAE